jgi:hypothetical protein
MRESAVHQQRANASHPGVAAVTDETDGGAHGSPPIIRENSVVLGQG